MMAGEKPQEKERNVHGFAIVIAIDLQAPGWLVAVIAVGAVALGIYAINVRKKMIPVQSR